MREMTAPFDNFHLFINRIHPNTDQAAVAMAAAKRQKETRNAFDSQETQLTGNEPRPLDRYIRWVGSNTNRLDRSISCNLNYK